MFEFSHSFAFQDNYGLHISHFFSLFFFAVVVLKVLYFQQVAHHVMALPPLIARFKAVVGRYMVWRVTIRGFGFGS
jgi:hypothetical protein